MRSGASQSRPSVADSTRPSDPFSTFLLSGPADLQPLRHVMARVSEPLQKTAVSMGRAEAEWVGPAARKGVLRCC